MGDLRSSMRAPEGAGTPEPTGTLSVALSQAEQKLAAEETALKRLRPKPLELQAEISADQRHELAVEKHLLDGFFRAKLQSQDQDLDVTDILMIRNLQAVAKHMIDRSRAR